ncbi:MAG: SDR family NAD(P)-dependent oxidoreductase, partial [Acidimicrobiales bacterium]
MTDQPDTTDAKEQTVRVLDRFRVDGQVALVTGAGRGIGRASALALAEAGADVVVAARTADQIEAVAEEIRAMGRRAEPVVFDVIE